MLTKRIVKFFDKLEDEVRGKLSHYPIAYAIVGGIGVVLFWRGVWHIADDVGLGNLSSFFLGMSILLLTGVFVSQFIGNRLIISGLIGEKKLSEKAEEEIKTEEDQIQEIQQTLDRMEKEIQELKK